MVAFKYMSAVETDQVVGANLKDKNYKDEGNCTLMIIVSSLDGHSGTY